VGKAELAMGTIGPMDIAADDAAALTRLLVPLTVHEREVFLLRYVCGYSARETGAALGLSDGKVAWRLHTALARLGQPATAGLGEVPISSPLRSTVTGPSSLTTMTVAPGSSKL
jgi:hypothetical protein